METIIWLIQPVATSPTALVKRHIWQRKCLRISIWKIDYNQNRFTCNEAHWLRHKNTPAFSIPAFATSAILPAATTGMAYNAIIKATGGIQSYNFTLASSTLPPGLNLNAFTGAISGTPAQAGTYNFKIQVMDYDSVTAVKKFTITVGAVFTKQ